MFGQHQMQPHDQSIYNQPYSQNNLQPSYSSYGMPPVNREPIKLPMSTPTTALELYGATLTRDDSGSPIKLLSITGKSVYKPYSLEELRAADYKAGRKGEITAKHSYVPTYGQNTSYISKPEGFSDNTAFGQPRFDSPPQGSSIFGTSTGFSGMQNSSPVQPQRPLSGFQGFSGLGQSSQGSSFFTNSSPSTLTQPANSTAFGQPQDSLRGFGQSTTSGPGYTAQGTSQSPSQSSSLFGGQGPFGSQPSTSTPFGQTGGFGTGSGTGYGSGLNLGGSGISGGQSVSGGSGGFSSGAFNSGGFSSGGFGSRSEPSALGASSGGSGTGGTGFGTSTTGGMGFSPSTISSGFGQTGGGVFGQNANSNVAEAPSLLRQPSYGAMGGGLGSSLVLNRGLGVGQGSSSGFGGSDGGYRPGEPSAQQIGSNSLSTPFGQGISGSGVGAGGGSLFGSKPLQTAPSIFTSGISTGSGSGASNSLFSPTGSIFSEKPSDPIRATSEIKPGIFGSIGSVEKPSAPAAPAPSLFGGSYFPSSNAAGQSSLSNGGSSFLPPKYSLFEKGTEGLEGVRRAEVKNTDPYLISGLNFKECNDYVKKKNVEIPKMLLERPVAEKQKFKVTTSFRSLANSSEQKKEIGTPKKTEGNFYTVPPMEKLRKMKEKNMKVSGLVIGQEGLGKIEYIVDIDLKDVDLNRIKEDVVFEHRSVTLYRDRSVEVGKALNRPARVTFEGVVAYSKSGGRPITGQRAEYPAKKMQEVEIHKEAKKFNGRIIHYDYDTGGIQMEVDHF